jgi:hypothetical protein
MVGEGKFTQTHDGCVLEQLKTRLSSGGTAAKFKHGQQLAARLCYAKQCLHRPWPDRNAPKGLRCIYSFNFYFKLVAVVEGAIFSGQVSILQINQRVIDCKSMWPDGFSRCHANGDKFSGLTQSVDNA